MDAIRSHGAEGYPHEICGVMVGPRGDRLVTEAKRARNIVVERARDRYEIDPRDHIRIQREADGANMDIVGYYHSHPGHPAQASRFDTERAWPGYAYLIVPVHHGVRAWTVGGRHRVATGHRRAVPCLDGTRPAPADPVGDARCIGRQEGPGQGFRISRSA